MGEVVVMSFMYTSLVMKGMKSKFRSFLPTFEKETELVPELQTDQDSLSWFCCTDFAQSSFKATGVGTELQPLFFLCVCL